MVEVLSGKLWKRRNSNMGPSLGSKSVVEDSGDGVAGRSATVAAGRGAADGTPRQATDGSDSRADHRAEGAVHCRSGDAAAHATDDSTRDAADGLTESFVLSGDAGDAADDAADDSAGCRADRASQYKISHLLELEGLLGRIVEVEQAGTRVQRPGPNFWFTQN